MANLMLLVASLTLVIVVSVQESVASVEDVCWKVTNMVIDKNLDDQEARDFTRDYLSGRILNIGGRDKLKDAVENIIGGGECSVSSLDHVATISQCTRDYLLLWFEKPTEEYAARCLTPEILKKAIRIGTESGGLFGRPSGSRQVAEILDEQFVADYLEANPKEKPYELFDIVIWNSKLTLPMVKLLEREAKKQGKDALEMFSNREAVESYIKKNIVKPWKTYEAAALKIMQKIERSGKFVQGGDRALYKSLGHYGQMFVFRKKVCSNVDYNIARVVSDVMLKLEFPSQSTEATS